LKIGSERSLRNQLAEPTAGQTFDQVFRNGRTQRNVTLGYTYTSVRLSIGSQWQNIHHWTLSTCLPYFLDYRIFVISIFCSQLSTCFFEEIIFALFQIFNSSSIVNLNGSKGIFGGC